MAEQKTSKKKLWDNTIEQLKQLHQADLNEPLETYFKKTPSRVTFIKKMPLIIKMKLINRFYTIYG